MCDNRCQQGSWTDAPPHDQRPVQRVCPVLRKRESHSDMRGHIALPWHKGQNSAASMPARHGQCDPTVIGLKRFGGAWDMPAIIQALGVDHQQRDQGRWSATELTEGTRVLKKAAAWKERWSVTRYPESVSWLAGLCALRTFPFFFFLFFFFNGGGTQKSFVVILGLAQRMF